METSENKGLNELVGGDISAGGNDRNVVGNTEIETGPVAKPFNDTSDYEKGTPPTTDRVFGRYRQDIPWFAIYSYGSSRYGRGLPVRETKNSKIVTKNSVEEKIEDLVKKSKNSDLKDKNYNAKLDKVLDIINDTNLTDKELETILKTINDKKVNKQV